MAAASARRADRLLGGPPAYPEQVGDEAGADRVLRVLLLANSYPTSATPSAAAYLSYRLDAMARRSDIETVGAALVPTYSGPAMTARQAMQLADARGLALAADANPILRQVNCRWRLTDIAAGRRGHRPNGAIASATTGVGILLRDHGAWRPDVVLAHGMYTLPAGEVARRVAAALGVPFVVAMHGSDVTHVMARDPGSAADTLWAAAATIYVSTALRATARALGAPKQGGRVIPNGVDSALFRPGHRAPHDPAAPRLLYVGNLLPVKGVDRLPAIMREVRAKAPGAHLDVLGEGPLRASVAAELGDAATFHGRRTPAQVADRMRASDVLVVPSRSEGWGCVVSEALACGTPVVASAVGGLVEAVGHPGRTVPEGPGYVKDFAARVLRAAGAGVEVAPQAWTWDEVVDAEVEVLRSAVTAHAESS